jgi:hypothetical protein
MNRCQVVECRLQQSFFSAPGADFSLARIRPVALIAVISAPATHAADKSAEADSVRFLRTDIESDLFYAQQWI